MKSFFLHPIGYVDGLEPLDALHVVLQLLHGRFETLLVGLLGQVGLVCDQWEALVLLVQLIPALLQALRGENHIHAIMELPLALEQRLLLLILTLWD